MLFQVFTGDVPPPLLRLHGASFGATHAPLTENLSLEIPPGLTAITGDEGTGKTTLLRLLANDLPEQHQQNTVSPVDALWIAPHLPGHDRSTPRQIWQAIHARCPRWNATLQTQLLEALGLVEHQDKELFMLSTGSRRKVGLIGLLASGVTVTCIDQPYAALDLASVKVLREFLTDMGKHTHRAWVIADYEADHALPWRSQITLTTP